MAFIIPNATDTGGSQKFANINQAEPDSLDMEALGNMLTACIRSGGAVTNSGNTINIAAGVAIFGGVPYAFNSSSFTNSADVGGTAFTAVVVRLSGTTASVVTLNGSPSTTNPTLPKSASTLTGTYNAASDYSPNTDVLLATVFRSGSTVSGHIVDKRITFTGSLHWSQSTVPTSGQGNNGDLVTVGTTVYVKATGSWFALSSQAVVDEIVPVGGIMMWPALTNPTGTGTRWLECNGQTVTSTSYPVLANAWGVSGTFVLPSYGNRFLRGTTNTGTGLISVNGGADSVSVPMRNHTHTLSNHTHTLAAHTHSASVTGTDGGHAHSGTLSNTSVTVNSGGTHDHNVVSRNKYVVVPGLDSVGVISIVKQTGGPTGGFTVPITTSTFAGPVPADERAELIPIGGVGSNITSFGSGTDVLIAAQAGSHSHTGSVSNGSVNISGAGTHGHTITVAEALSSTSGFPSNNSTNEVGDGAAPTISTLPTYSSVRYFVRAV